MEESKLEGHTDQANLLLSLAKNVDVIMSSQEELRGEVRHLREVVIGNGDSNSLLHQIKQLEFGQVVAKADRERMEKQINSLSDCIGRIEREEIAQQGERKAFDSDQKKILLRLDAIEQAQEEQGDLIQAFRNRIIGIVAVLSLLAGAGAGFAVAARFLGTMIQ